MKRIFAFSLIISIYLSLTAFAAEIPRNLKGEVETASKNGRLLYNSFISGPVSDSNTLKKIDEIKSKIKDLCDFNYIPYVVKSDKNKIIYLIAQDPAEGHTVFGKHYKIINDKIIPSTKTCFITSPPPDKKVAGAYVTHLLSDTPTEFHVFISLKTKEPVFIGTAKGMWKAENGTVEFLKERK